MNKPDIHTTQLDYWKRKKHLKRRHPTHPAVRAFVEPKIKLINNKTDLPSNPKIIDVGAGNGYFSYQWNLEGDVTAVDFSDVILTNNPVEKKMVMDARDLKFPDNSFDISFCNAVLHHIDGFDRLKVIQEMARVSRRYVAISEPNRNNPLMAIFHILKKEERGAMVFSLSYCKKLLGDAGLRIMHATSWGFLTPNRMPFSGILLPAFKLFERPVPLGAMNIVIAEKLSQSN